MYILNSYFTFLIANESLTRQLVNSLVALKGYGTSLRINITSSLIVISVNLH